MQAIADELHESWLNGNLKYVIGEVLNQSTKAKTALLSALLMSAMSVGDRTTYLRMLNDRVNQ